MDPSITFHGGAGVVTGSCYMVRHAGGALLVDCGLFQGTKTVREWNYGPLPFDPAEPAALLLTHAHIDHCGLIPKLVKAGFTGPIFATSGTIDLLGFVLPDSGGIQEAEVDQLNRRNAHRGRPPVTPIYTRQDAIACLGGFRAVPYESWFDVMPGVRARFWDPGHILGSASVELSVHVPEAAPLQVLFSGDVGPGGKSLQQNPKGPSGADYAVVEATYGDRERPEVSADERRQALAGEVRAALAAGGNLLIPCFAVERTQELLHDLDYLFDQGALPPTDVFVDSPLAVHATEVFARHMSGKAARHMFQRRNFHYVVDVEDSKKINRIRGGAIIMAGSGMCDAGRIRHHLRNQIWRDDTTVLLVGYQAPGTMGALLQGGARRVRIHGDEIEVRARIRELDLYSGHADRKGLLDWISARRPIRRGLFLVHAEEGARQALQQCLIERGWDGRVIRLPRLDAGYALGTAGAEPLAAGPSRLDDPLAVGADWHNRYAQTVLDLDQTLRGFERDSERDALLRTVQAALRKSRRDPVN
ncbi:MAG TPA: MBL fold metallo-hydrolase [Candidatus Cybelea sp.]|nr:MBL fold metallo-hydrolase [Candidatus Cybelea sp.]